MSVSKTIVTSDKYNTTFNSPTIKLLCNTCFPQLGFIFRIIFNSLCLPLKKGEILFCNFQSVVM